MRLDSKFYHDWLGINVAPGSVPDHYTLLGIRPGETNIQEIEKAVDARFALMRTVDASVYFDEFREMLRELETARAELIFPLRSHGATAGGMPSVMAAGAGVISANPANHAPVGDGSLVGWWSKAVFFTQCAVAFGLGLCVCISMMKSVARHPNGAVIFVTKDNHKVEATPYTTLPDDSGKRPDVGQVEDKIRELAADVPAAAALKIETAPKVETHQSVAEESDTTENNALETETPVQDEQPVSPGENTQTQSISPNMEVAEEDTAVDAGTQPSLVPAIQTPGGKRRSPLLKMHDKNVVAESKIESASQQTAADTHIADDSPAASVAVQTSEADTLAAQELPTVLSTHLPETVEADYQDITTVLADHPAGTPEPTAVQTPAVAVAAKIPVPTDAELQRDQQLLTKELQEKIMTPADRKNFIGELARGATAKTLAPAKRYVALTGALALATQDMDAREAMKIVSTIEQYFETDAAQTRYTVLQNIAKLLAAQNQTAETTAAAADFLAVANDVCLKLVTTRHFELAARLSDTILNVCSDTQAQGLATSSALAQKVRYNSLWNRWQGYEKALETLKTLPEDRGANLVVGNWLCELERNLPEALPYFARGTDETLRRLAASEIGMADAGAVDSETAVKLGDGWWQLAELKAYPVGMRKVMREHAISIYREIEPMVQDPMARNHISSRIKQESMER